MAYKQVNGTNSSYRCANGGGPTTGAYVLTSACITDGVTACASNGGTPLPFDFTHFPNGEGIKIFSGGSIQSGAYITSTQQMVLFESDPSSGSYPIQTNNNGAGYVTPSANGPVAPTGTPNGAVGTGYAWSYTYGAAAPYEIQISATGGPIYVYGLLQDNSTVNGVVAYGEARGGLSIGDYGVFPLGIIQPWHQAMNVQLMFYEAKDNGGNNPSGDCSKNSTAAPSTYIPFPTLWSNVVSMFNGTPTTSLMDIVAIGSYDVGSDLCVPFQNETMRTSMQSLTPQETYWDGFYQSTNAQMISSGLNQMAVGNVHSVLNQQTAIGDALAQFLGYSIWPTSTITRPVSNLLTISNEFALKDPIATGATYRWDIYQYNAGAAAESDIGTLWKINTSSADILCLGNNFVGCGSTAARIDQTGTLTINSTANQIELPPRTLRLASTLPHRMAAIIAFKPHQTLGKAEQQTGGTTTSRARRSGAWASTIKATPFSGTTVPRHTNPSGFRRGCRMTRWTGTQTG